MRLPQSRVLLILLLLIPLFTLYALHSTSGQAPLTFHIPTTYAQCQPNNRNQGLISAVGNVTGNTFGNTLGEGGTAVCITETQNASYRAFKLSDDPYQDLEDQFYTRSRAPNGVKRAGGPPANLAFTGANSGDGIYLQKGDLTVNASSGRGTQVIFIRGNLNIMKDITYADLDQDSGLVFIVSGNINIDKEVTKINAVLISSGIICTATQDFANSTCYNGQIDMKQLVVYGSLISLNKKDVPGGAIKLGRNLALNDQPAELVKKQPKYLYNLRKGLLTKDLIITTEDQHYQITPGGAPNPPPNPAPPPGPVTCSPLPNSISGDDVKIAGCICLSGAATCN